ncbi:MAG: hypothetical protein GY714_31900 [Desulfobacterales bacterium]|nr:hypothetical protein [Desulfobacterales bacterium]
MKLLCRKIIVLTIIIYGFSISCVWAATNCRERSDLRKDPEWSCKSAKNLMKEYGYIPAELFKTWGALELDADAVLSDKGGVYNMTVYLTHDNVSLDGKGQTLTPTNNHSGIRAPHSKSVSNISIKNLKIVNSTSYGINLKRFFRADEPCLVSESSDELTVTDWQWQGNNCAEAFLGHNNIVIDNVDIQNPKQSGIYVGQNSEYIKILNTTINGAYLGIYLESGTLKTLISGCDFTNLKNREAISIDASQYNIVEYSYFNTAKGGINLYKNAGERNDQVCPVLRPFGSDHNIIRYNNFYHADVNVAWREGKSLTNCSEWLECSPNFRDRADNNVIYGNEFHYGAQLDIHDNTYTVLDNIFYDGSELELGAKHHDYNMHGVVADNVFHSNSRIKYNNNNHFNSSWWPVEIYNNVRPDGTCVNSQCGKNANPPERHNWFLSGKAVLNKSLNATGNISVIAGGSLTINDGAVINLKSGKSLVVDPGGSLHITNGRIRVN